MSSKEGATTSVSPKDDNGNNNNKNNSSSSNNNNNNNNNNTAKSSKISSSNNTNTNPPTKQKDPKKQRPSFDPPKYVVTIVSPRVVYLNETDASLDEWKEFETKPQSSATVLHLHVLLVSLLNRLLRARLFPRRAVHSFVTSGTTATVAHNNHNHNNDSECIVFSILTPAQVLPILLSKCEHFGVGNLVGLVYAVPLETCALPVFVADDDDDELLEVPSWMTTAPSTTATPSMDAASQSSLLPHSGGGGLHASASTNSLTGVVVMAPTQQHNINKRVPTPSALRPVVSDTLTMDASLPHNNNNNTNNGLPQTSNAPPTPPSLPAPQPIVARSSSHPDVLQTAPKVSVNNKTNSNNTSKTNKNKPPAVVKEKILEQIPEAKGPLINNKNSNSLRHGSLHTIVSVDDGLLGKNNNSLHGTKVPVSSSPSTRTTNNNQNNSNNQKSALIQKVLDARKEWLATASRIRVEQVAQEVAAAAALTWDYLLFVVCAAAIAATGLATNSSVTVLASMLVSPIMGPILAVTFGTMIRRPKMIQMALRNEVISLILCIAVGACGGLVVWLTRLYESSDWPANEMTARGDPSGLVAGVLIALPSGMATALSTLGKNSSGLVGVAISLSLLPPAVNAGLCWMFALLDQTRLVDKSVDDDTNYWMVGTTSFALTLINIFCIWLAGVFTFWLKEVAPVEHKNAFWSRDLKIARQQQKAPGVGTIKDGLQAAMDLKTKFSVEEGGDHGNNSLTGGRSHSERDRRRTLRNRHYAGPSKWDDALLWDHPLPPGRAPTTIPRQPIDRASSAGILEQTEALGGMDEASEMLFNNHLFRSDDTSVYDDDDDADNGYNLSYATVHPADVYEEILWQRIPHPKR